MTSQEIVRRARHAPAELSALQLQVRAAELFDVAARLFRKQPTKAAQQVLAFASDALEYLYLVHDGCGRDQRERGVFALRMAGAEVAGLMVTRGTNAEAVS